MKEFLQRYMPVDASVHGDQLDTLTAYVHWLMLVLFIFWGAFFLFTLWRFSKKRNPKASYAGMQSHWSTWGEAGVAIFEVILLFGISIPAWYSWTNRPKKETNPLEVRLVAEQFAWNVQYPGPDGKFGRRDVKLVDATNPLGLDPNDPDGKDDITTLNQLDVEVNRPVIAYISSKDVIHSFFLPTMRVKQDAIPGMEVPVHFQPKMVNTEQWEIACAQLCGLGHYRMRGMLTVHDHAGFQTWLKEQGPEDTTEPEPNAVPAATPAEPTTTAHS